MKSKVASIKHQFSWTITEVLYISTGAHNIFIKTNPVVIPFCTKLDAYILSGYVEADYDQVGFDEDITCTGGDIPIVGMFK